MAQTISLVSFGVAAPQWEAGTATAIELTDLILQLHTLEIESAPSALAVSIVDAGGSGNIVFEIDGEEVFEIEPDPDGGLDLASVPVPDLKDSGGNSLMQPGVHELRAIQGLSYGVAEFSIVDPPPPLPEIVPDDAPPVPVPGAVQPNGVQRWVFQDLMPGGLGSWILPMNPVEMESPAFARSLTSRSSLSEQNTTYHVWENAWEPVEWKFSGVVPTEAMRDKLEDFAGLNRRWYLHDHRGRAWKVTFQDLELTPRLTQNWDGTLTNEVHDYVAVVRVMDREWVEV